MALAPGTRLGHYEILGPLGVGGMGEVYRARDGKLGREVAIKVLRDRHASDPDWLGRFEREARLLAALNHVNIATVHGLDEADGTRYLVMELVPGQTLAERLARGPLPLDEALTVCRQIAEALEAAHEKGIIHRDLKPANVKITPEGKVKVLDFGLARSTAPDPEPGDPTISYQPRTHEGVIVGTPAYMAPEQARGKPLDRRCDIWAFGCVLYEALTGKRPFAGATFSDTLAAVIERTPDWEALPARIPPRIAELDRRCLQKDPGRRLRDAGDARLEIEEALAELARGPLAPPAAPRAARRWWPLLVAMLAAAAFALGMWLQSRREGSAAGGTQPARPATWSGEFLLGGMTRAFGPRVSPDGHWLAFLVLEQGQAQVGVMWLASGEWWILTHHRDRGGANSICWSADANLIYYDRLFDVPVGVFSISPRQKGKEVLVLKDVECPQVAADGSLIVCKIDEQGYSRLYRFWQDNPDRTGAEVGPRIEFSRGWPLPVRALRNKNQVVFCGKLVDDREAARKRRVYLLDLETKELRTLPVEEVALEFVQLALAPDDRFAYTILPVGNAFRVTRIPLAGEGSPEPLLTLLTPAFGLDVDSGGRVYLDQVQRPQQVLRFDAKGGQPELISSTSGGWDTPTYAPEPVELPDGRVLLPSKVSGRDRLLAARPGQDPAPFLQQDQGEAAMPAVLLDERRVAFLAGPKADRRLRVAELEEDQVRLRGTLKSVPTTGLTGLAASPNGKTIYYVHSRKLWKVPTDDNLPRELVREPADSVAVYPETGDLLVQTYKKGGVRLFRIPAQGPPGEVKVKPGPLRLVGAAIGGRAIGKDGRVLLTATSADNWFWRVALLDPTTGQFERIPVVFEGDIYLASWSKDGKVLGVGFPYKAELWQLTPQR